MSDRKHTICKPQKPSRDKKPIHDLSQDWASKNKSAIKAYNLFIEQNGNFGDEYRKF